MFSYRALKNAVEYIKTENHNQISEILMMIEDEEKRNNVIIDIFSLIFLIDNSLF